MPGTLRPFHPYGISIPVLINRGVLHPIDAYSYIFDISNREKGIDYVYSGEEENAVQRVLQQNNLEEGRTVLISPSQNTHQEGGNAILKSISELKEFFQSLNLKVCANGHGLSEAQEEILRENKIPLIRMDPFLSVLFVERAGISFAPSTGIVECLLLSSRKARQIHLINSASMPGCQEWDDGVNDRIFTSHYKYRNYSSESYLPITLNISAELSAIYSGWASSQVSRFLEERKY